MQQGGLRRFSMDLTAVAQAVIMRADGKESRVRPYQDLILEILV